MERLLALLGLALLATGCAGLAAAPLSSASSLFSSPNSSALEIHNQTEVRLDEANFVVVKTNVVGRCKGFAFLGIINMVPARFNTAMNRLYTQAGMQSGHPQTLANIVMERTSTYWILFSIPQVSVRADLIQFVPNQNANSSAGATPIPVPPGRLDPLPR